MYVSRAPDDWVILAEEEIDASVAANQSSNLIPIYLQIINAIHQDVQWVDFSSTCTGTPQLCDLIVPLVSLIILDDDQSYDCSGILTYN